MKVLKSWLQEYIAEPLPETSVLVEKLSLHSFEIEGVEVLPDGDVCIDVDVLPNRAHDCLSQRGIAREIATVFDLTFKQKTWEYMTDASVKTSEHLSVFVESPTLVPRAMKRVVANVHVGESPDWLKNRLMALGQRSINNVVDITNYVMLETGQPVHAFDYDKLAGGEKKTITVRSAHRAEKITTLDEKELTLSEGMLVWADEKQALDIAGIKGGNMSGIDAKTTRLMISICNFNPTTIRKTSRTLGLITDASKRFEQGITPELTAQAMNQTCALLQDLAKAWISEDMVDIYPVKPDQYSIEIAPAEVNKLLGSRMTGTDVEDILRRLGFVYTKDTNQKENYMVTIPLERLDLMPGREALVSGNKEDLIEEIGRVYGYAKIEPQLLQKEREPEVHPLFFYIQKVRNVLVKLGFSEVYTYSFVEHGEIEIQNPMAHDKAFLRASLQAGLIESLEHNLKYKDLLGLAMVQLFEVGTVFTREHEYVALGIALGGVKQKEIDALVDHVQKALRDVLGDTIEIKLTNGVWETDLSKLVTTLKTPDTYDSLAVPKPVTTTFTPISIYPFVLRDIALWVPHDVSKTDVLQLIIQEAGPLLVRVTLFDEYQKDDRLSYAYHLVFQSYEKTLSDEEVNVCMENIYKAITTKGWETR